jgi:cytidyltransferase-like protein
MNINICIVVSGGFDPVHKGHLRMFQNAKGLGENLIVILNNDDFLLKKKGYIFMGQDERKEIIEGFECVDEVIISIDEDLTVCSTLELLASQGRADVFANGGDRRNTNDNPEYQICSKHNIEMLFNIGGEKIQSSSDLVKNEVKKPWGKYLTFEQGDGYLVKRINVDAGESLSLQSHEHRTELWVVVKGEATVTLDGQKKIHNKGECIFIPLKSKHRLENMSKDPLELIEVQFGDILSEEDIIRFEDIYGRI